MGDDVQCTLLINVAVCRNLSSKFYKTSITTRQTMQFNGNLRILPFITKIICLYVMWRFLHSNCHPQQQEQSQHVQVRAQRQDIGPLSVLTVTATHVGNNFVRKWREAKYGHRLFRLTNSVSMQSYQTVATHSHILYLFILVGLVTALSQHKTRSEI